MRQSRAFSWMLLLALLVALPGCPQLGAHVDTNAIAGQYTGQVLGLDGKPAANVEVHGYLVSNNSAGLVSNNAASIVSNNTAGYKAQDVQLDARTDASGRFTLASDAPELNIEAVMSDNIKAITLEVPSSKQGLALQLAYTGSISGRVTAPGTSVTNFEGVDVFVPGTSYLAKADAAGHYLLSNVAPGTFSLVASKTGLGRANLPSVQVQSKATVQAADLALSLTAPTITAITPANAAAGAIVTLAGSHFGATTGDTLVVSFNGTIATSVQRVDDHTLKATVPDGAASGNVVVTVGGVVSNAQPLTVIKSLSLDPGNAILAVGDTLTLSPTALDTAGAPVSNPTVTWAATGSAVTLQGTVATAAATGDATVTISSGHLSSTRHLRVVSQLPQVSTIAGSSNGFADGQGAGAQFASPYGLAVRASGSLLVADSDNNRIREVTPSGAVTTFAGTGTAGGTDGPRATAEFDSPMCLAEDTNGDVYVTEYKSRIRKISAAGAVTLWAGNGTDGYQDGPLASSMFNSPYGIVIASDHTVYVADTYNHCIRQIKNGIVSTLAGNGASGFADGTGSAARFFKPRGLAFDASGDLIVADGDNNAIRKVTRNGVVTTIAGGTKAGYYDGNGSEALFSRPAAVAIDSNGLIYVADENNHVIRLVAPDGTVWTYAGSGIGSFGDGTAKTASFGLASGVAFGTDGSLFVVDNRVRKIQP